MPEREKAPAANEGQPKDSLQGTGPSLALAGDPEKAVEFLRQFNPDGPWVLVAIIPDGRISAATFGPAREEACKNWIASRIGRENIYFHVNDVGDKRLTKKAEKRDIVAARWLHVDVDPSSDDLDGERADILARLRGFSPAPTIIIDSGGGYQAFWRLRKAVDTTTEVGRAEIEDRNRWLAHELGGDNCHNVDRIMRLPGTINVPNAKKRRAGRVPARTWLVSFAASFSDMVDFEETSEIAAVAPVRTRYVGSWDGPTDALFLCEALPPWAFRLLNDSRDASRQPFASRSEHVWAFVGACVRDGTPPELIRWCITNPHFAVSGHILDQKNPDRAADRTISRMEAACEQG